ncbi:hypothetical protein GLOIN_2v1782324 [Rhizophagus irregularis DAOM 181602=DAOM 197198]|nr:hypothetical protein GLOIN_2v1782324 [Rhizophagus irregularis DAOM 181602=DAOM 197198]
MPGGPAKRLADFAKECTVRQFPPTTYPLKDEDVELITDKELTLSPQLEIVESGRCEGVKVRYRQRIKSILNFAGFSERFLVAYTLRARAPEYKQQNIKNSKKRTRTLR